MLGVWLEGASKVPAQGGMAVQQMLQFPLSWPQGSISITERRFR